MVNLTGWPFRVAISGNPASGAAAEHAIRLGVSPGSEAADHVQIAIRAFADLADDGGLCGATLPPTQSRARFATSPDPVLIAGELVWNFGSLAIDPLAIAVLLNLLEGSPAAVASVRLSTSGRDAALPRAVDHYPAMTSHQPFQLLFDPDDRRVAVEVVFAQPPPPELSEQIVLTIYNWALVGILGGFRQAGLAPLESAFIPSQEVELTGIMLTHELEKVAADDAVFASLVNLLTRMSLTLAPIAEVTVT